MEAQRTIFCPGWLCCSPFACHQQASWSWAPRVSSAQSRKYPQPLTTSCDWCPNPGFCWCIGMKLKTTPGQGSLCMVAGSSAISLHPWEYLSWQVSLLGHGAVIRGEHLTFPIGSTLYVALWPAVLSWALYYLEGTSVTGSCSPKPSGAGPPIFRLWSFMSWSFASQHVDCLLIQWLSHPPNVAFLQGPPWKQQFILQWHQTQAGCNRHIWRWVTSLWPSRLPAQLWGQVPMSRQRLPQAPVASLSVFCPGVFFWIHRTCLAQGWWSSVNRWCKVADNSLAHHPLDEYICKEFWKLSPVPGQGQQSPFLWWLFLFGHTLPHFCFLGAPPPNLCPQFTHISGPALEVEGQTEPLSH